MGDKSYSLNDGYKITNSMGRDDSDWGETKLATDEPVSGGVGNVSHSLKGATVNPTGNS